MNAAELLALARQELFDTVQPYLWSDDLLYTYIDDAQKQFCRYTEGVEDARSFSLKIKPDLVWYDLDPLILKVRSAHDQLTGRELPIWTTEYMSTNRIWFDGSRGPMKALVSGLEKGVLRTFPVPSEASTVELRVFRLPYDVGVGGEFEIDPQHIINLLFWVKYRAYNVQDAEAADEKKALSNRTDFEAYCAKARVEQGRLRRPVATVAYGGI